MFASALLYCLSHPVRAAYTLASDPPEVLTALQERYVAARERPVPPGLYQPDSGWECRMHELLGMPQPCPAISEFSALWPEVMEELKAKGIRVGPESFKFWNDGDAGFVRAIWCLTRHLRPSNVVETGVAHGVSSRFILEALERNGGDGHLWSVDHPPLEHVWHEQIGAAVGGRYSARWSRANGAFPAYFPNFARLTFSYMIACIASITYASRWTALGRRCGRAERSSSMTSMSTGVSNPLCRRLPVTSR